MGALGCAEGQDQRHPGGAKHAGAARWVFGGWMWRGKGGVRLVEGGQRMIGGPPATAGLVLID